MSIVNTYNMFLSSERRSSGTSSNFQTSLSNPIILSSPNNWFTVRVGSAEVPYVFKLINSSNNTINFSMTRNAVPYSGSITLSPGNYNILTLLNEVKARLGTAITTLTGWNPTNLFNFTYDRSTGHATFSVVGTDSIATSITIAANQPVFLKCVGMTAAFTFGYTTPSTRVDAESTQNVNVSQNTAIYVRSDSFTQSVSIENIAVDNEVSNIIAKIQITALPQSYVLWTNPTDLEVKVGNRIIDTVSLYLGSSTSYTLDLGNLDWSLRLTVHEWTNDPAREDMAVNMIAPVPTDEGVQQLLSEREKAIEKLQRLKKKLAIE